MYCTSAHPILATHHYAVETQVGISATNRNFRGRMGSPSADAYLASPAVVAASAIAGYITAPSRGVTGDILHSIQVGRHTVVAGSAGCTFPLWATQVFRACVSCDCSPTATVRLDGINFSLML